MRMNWKDLLKADPTGWLLSEGEPWVRYRTLIDLLDRNEDDPAVAEARRAMLADERIKGLVTALRDEERGIPATRGEKVITHIKPNSFYWVLCFLAEIGLTKDDLGLAEIVELLFELHTPDGLFTIFREGEKPICLAGLLGEDIGGAGWPKSGKIDIMEFIGREPDRVYGTVHGPGYSSGNGVGGFHILPGEALSNDFYVFAIEWEAEEIRWYVDEAQYFRVTPEMLPGEWVYDYPFFIILNLAIGGNWPGYPDETTIFPQFMYVDYVCVYQTSE